MVIYYNSVNNNLAKSSKGGERRKIWKQWKS